MKTKPFKLLRDKMTPEQQAESAAQAQLYLTHLALQELRQSLDITLEELAQKLGINQSALSSFENQENIYNKLIFAHQVSSVYNFEFNS